MSREETQTATAASTFIALILGWSVRAAGNYWWEWKHLKLNTEPDQLIAVGAGIMLMVFVLLFCLVAALAEIDGGPK